MCRSLLIRGEWPMGKIRLPTLGPDTGRSLPIAELVFKPCFDSRLPFLGLPTDCGTACNAMHAQTSEVDYLRISRAVS